MKLFGSAVTAIFLLILVAAFLFPKLAVQIGRELIPGIAQTNKSAQPQPVAQPTFHGPTGQPFVNGPSAPPPTPPPIQ